MCARHEGKSVAIGLCFFSLILEGYDLLTYGTVVSSLLDHEQWGLDAASIGLLGSLVGIGMLAGAPVAGAAADRWGRRRVIIVAVGTFSVASVACGVAPTLLVFGMGRLGVGFGAGLLMPVAAATLIEFSPVGARARAVAVGFAGTSVGGIVAGVLSLWLVPAYGFRAMFLAGAVPGIVLAVLMLKYLPESPEYLSATRRQKAASRVRLRHRLPPYQQDTVECDGWADARGYRALFSGDRRTATLLFWGTTLICLLVLFGVATWLPKLMQSAGYPLTAALSFLLILNFGGVVGVLTGGSVADRYGLRRVTIIYFLCTAVALMLLAASPALVWVYLLVFVAGFGTVGTQSLLNTFIGSYYPAKSRATGIGMALSVGRLGVIAGPTYGGFLVSAGVGPSWQLFAFAIPAVVGATLTMLIPDSGRDKSTTRASGGRVPEL